MQVAIETEWQLPQEIWLSETTGRAGAGDCPDSLVDLLIRLIATFDEIGLPVDFVRTGSHPSRIETALLSREPMAACDQQQLCGRALATIGDVPRRFPSHVEPGATVPAGEMRLQLRLSLGDGGPLFSAVPSMTGLRHVLPDLESHLYGDAGLDVRKHGTAIAAVIPLAHDDDWGWEVRVPVPGTDPYVLLAALIASVLHGLGHQDSEHSSSACTALRPPVDPSAGQDAVLAAQDAVGTDRLDYGLPVALSPLRRAR